MFLDDELRQRRRGEQQRHEFLTSLTAGLRRSLQAAPGAELIDVQRQDRDSHRIRATVRAPIVIDPSECASCRRLPLVHPAPIQLVVRSVVARTLIAVSTSMKIRGALLRQRAIDVLTGLLAQRDRDAELLRVRVADAAEAVDSR